MLRPSCCSYCYAELALPQAASAPPATRVTSATATRLDRTSNTFKVPFVNEAAHPPPPPNSELTAEEPLLLLLLEPVPPVAPPAPAPVSLTVVAATVPFEFFAPATTTVSPGRTAFLPTATFLVTLVALESVTLTVLPVASVM